MNRKIQKQEMSKYPVIPLKKPFEDARGVIQNLVSLDESQIRSAVLIQSLKGSIRGNHYLVRVVLSLSC